MAFLLMSVKTQFDWITEIAKIPILGAAFLFVVMFVPAVLLSFLAQAIIPGCMMISDLQKQCYCFYPVGIYSCGLAK
jgi:hypothetical protein